MNIRELHEKFFERYELPKIEPLTIGFSDIDPPLKPDEGIQDHEELDNLLGGSFAKGHYHLTKDQLERLADKLNIQYPPEILYSQTITIFAFEEMTPYIVQGKNVILTA